MKNIKYFFLSTLLVGMVSCSDDEYFGPEEPIVEELPALTSGSVDFSTYVSLGNSLTAGFSDNALFVAGQQNSFPNQLAQKFAMVGGGSFTQPLMNDNLGGIAVGGNRILNPRLVFNGSGPAGIETLIGPVTVSTDLLVNNPSGPFNNMGVPGAKSYHLLFDGYGNLANLNAGLANPYFIRMASAPNATVLGDALAQSPSFFTLWIGNNDVLGYALSGGDGSDPITPLDGPPGVGFTQTYGALVQALTAGGAQGIVGNIPNVTSIPHFTTVPYNPLDPSNPDFGPQIPTLNAIFGALNQVFAALGEPERSIVFNTDAASAVVIKDETLTDFSAQISGALGASPAFAAFVQSLGLPAEAAPLVAGLMGQVYGQARQATEDDLFVLPSSSTIGTVNTDSVQFLMSQGLPQALAGQFSIEGITLPLADKWALIPSEQEEIATAIQAFNTVIDNVRQQAGLGLMDANSLLDQLANGGIPTGDFNLTSDLVLGGAFSLDGVHPNARGYALIANEFLKAIDATYGSNFEASGNLLDVGDFPTNYPPSLQ